MAELLSFGLHSTFVSDSGAQLESKFCTKLPITLGPFTKFCLCNNQAINLQGTYIV